MSGGLKALQPTDGDITKMLMGKSHIGTKNCGFQVCIIPPPNTPTISWVWPRE